MPKPLPDRLRDVGCDREPFTPDHAKRSGRPVSKSQPRTSPRTETDGASSKKEKDPTGFMPAGSGEKEE